jgi:hypothetical protein
MVSHSKPAANQKNLDYLEFKRLAHDMRENESREAFERLWAKIDPSLPPKPPKE